MSSFEIAVYQTNQLGDELESDGKYRYKASRAMKKFIDNSFDHSGNQHYVSVDNPSEDVYAPTQDTKTDITTNDPCGSPNTYDYSALCYWWQDYIDCSLTERDDCMLLLTARDSKNSGRTWQNYYATAEGGHYVAQLDDVSYSDFGCGTDYTAMETIMHEFAHALLARSNEHNHGNVYQHDCGFWCSNWYKTPMDYDKNADTNECGYSIDNTHDAECMAMYYDPDCSTDHFVHTTNHE